MEKQEHYTTISSRHRFDYFYKQKPTSKRHRLDGPSALSEGYMDYKYYFYVNDLYICNITIDTDTHKLIYSYCKLSTK
jgi:hypothetical protein